MKTPVAALALTLAALSAPSAAGQTQRIMTSDDLGTLTARAPDHRIPYGPLPLQYGNLRLPKGAGPHPLVIFIHGGCWLSEFTVSHAAALEQAIADAGYAVWSLEYRRVGDEGGGWPGTFTDVASGADFIRGIAPTYGLDLTRVVASGHSAGGQLALWLAARPRIPRSSELYVARPLPIRAVLALAPAADLEGLSRDGACDNAVNRVMGGTPAALPERYRDASPMQLAPIPVPQTLVLGAHDTSWSPAGRAYAARAVAAGDTHVRIVEAPDSGHFEMIAPATTTWPLVVGALRTVFASLTP